MAEEKNQNKYYKCPHCPCLFLNQSDLNKHVSCFGNHTYEHEQQYRKTHGRVEHGYGEE